MKEKKRTKMCVWQRSFIHSCIKEHKIKLFARGGEILKNIRGILKILVILSIWVIFSKISLYIENNFNNILSIEVSVDSFTFPEIIEKGDKRLKKETQETTQENTQEHKLELSSREGSEVQREEVISKNTTVTVNSNLRVLSNLTAEDYNKMLAKTGLAELGHGFVEAEQKYKINGLYLVGLCALESAWGKSNFAINRNNLTGINAIDSNPGKAYYFKSKEDCILATAKLLSEKYLTEGACYYNGMTALAIDVRYCSDKQHAYKIVSIINKLVTKI